MLGRPQRGQAEEQGNQGGEDDPTDTFAIQQVHDVQKKEPPIAEVLAPHQGVVRLPGPGQVEGQGRVGGLCRACGSEVCVGPFLPVAQAL
eukprot:15457387-Alexandrium_andersonii.AAC.1